ncbi:adenylate/guanylate cyclase domain-containing protein [Pannonibacter sp. Pt2]|uniref:Adenylate/guanylate cyclase domain-containing protein n=1 Tax=Pannonibacter anstelovis TaxID=3121537 RepID=A0ABU7ZK11_9HYPH
MPFTLRLTPTLATVIGTFVFLTTASVLYVEGTASRRIVAGLGSRLVDLGMDAYEQRFSSKINILRNQAGFIAAAFARGASPITLDEDVARLAFGGLAAAPEGTRITVARAAQGDALEISQMTGGGMMLRRFPQDASTELAARLTQAEAAAGPFWLPPDYDVLRRETLLSYVAPVRREGVYLGYAAVSIPSSGLSQIARDLSDSQLEVFLLYGEKELLAHPDLNPKDATLSEKNDLVDIGKAPDPLLARLASLTPVDPRRFDLGEAHAMFEGETEEHGRYYVVLERTAAKFGELPVITGAIMPASVLEQPLEELYISILIALSILVAALAGSAAMAYRIAQPIRRAAAGARAIARLDIAGLKPLPSSRIEELKDLASGFNAMTTALAAFVRYVPRSLVLKLLREGSGSAAPQERQVAVLFTDVVGFTSICEGMDARATADFVNHHLTLIGSVVERHGGTIDKYIGDSVMAFWGAPDHMDNPASSAAAAALDIERALKADNALRREKGLEPVRIRAGLHVGPLIVGDIGAPGRVNYTVIGDTVNIAARLESLGHAVDPGAEAVILASADVASALAAQTGASRPVITPLGEQTVKGKSQPVTVVRLSLPDDQG